MTAAPKSGLGDLCCMQRAFWQKRASMAFLEKRAGWRSKSCYHISCRTAEPTTDGCHVIWRPVVSVCCCHCLVFGTLEPQEQARGHANRRQWRSTDSDGWDVGATIKCFACLACVDVAVVRGLNYQVNCHVVKLEVCMLRREGSKRQFFYRLDP